MASPPSSRPSMVGVFGPSVCDPKNLTFQLKRQHRRWKGGRRGEGAKEEREGRWAGCEGRRTARGGGGHERERRRGGQDGFRRPGVPGQSRGFGEGGSGAERQSGLLGLLHLRCCASESGQGLGVQAVQVRESLGRAKGGGRGEAVAWGEEGRRRERRTAPALESCVVLIGRF